MKIALLTIATNKYIQFTNPLLESVKKYFLIDHTVDMFVHTNIKIIPSGCIKIFQEHQPFPYPTLMRYHIFTKNKSQYENYDYYFYCDIDMKFVDYVGEEIFGNMTATRHPGFYNKPRRDFSYETRKESTAYIADNEGEYYFCGGFNGGKDYLKMAQTISNNIDIDKNNGITAVWHDESHLNRYLIDNKPDVVLTPEYCYPEPPTGLNWGLEQFKPKLMALNKKHDSIR